MDLDATVLTTFRARFEAKEPDPKNFVRRVTKLDVYLTVEDLVEARRSKGFAWEGIAEDFSALGVEMPVATLKTCFRRARNLKRSGTTARPRSPRRSSRPLRVERQANRSGGDSAAEMHPTRETGSCPPVDTNDPTTLAVTEVPCIAPENAPQLAAEAPSESPERSAHAASDSADAVVGNTPPAAAADDDALAVEALSQSSPVGESVTNWGSREKMLRDADSDLAAPTDDLRTPAPDARSPAATRSAAHDSPQAPVVERAAGKDVARDELATPAGAGAHRPDVNRLSELRARASPPEKRRMAFVPRPDEEL